MQVQHPRATPADGRKPPSKVSIPGHGNVSVDEDGYLSDLDEATAERAMSVLGDAYEVEYDETGDVVVETDDEKSLFLEQQPGEYTIDELEAALADTELTDSERTALVESERNGKDRGGAVEAIEEA
jgi:biopolymer transport protein ExbD